MGDQKIHSMFVVFTLPVIVSVFVQWAYANPVMAKAVIKSIGIATNFLFSIFGYLL
jgi:hypothetical protein